MKPYLFIQARVGSTRLPGKILLRIEGKTILELLVERVRHMGLPVLITGSEDRNRDLVDEAKRLGLDFFCGEENNVLDRFYWAAKKFSGDIIVRVLGDAPLTDPELIKRALEQFKKEGPDILWTQGVPYGMGFEVFTKEALERGWKDMKGRHTGDLSSVFINPVDCLMESETFRHARLVYPKDYSRFRLALDYLEDFEVMKKVFEELYQGNPRFGIEDIVALLKKRPAIQALNNVHPIPDSYR